MDFVKKDLIELVDKYFGLSEEGLEIFKENVYSPDIAKEYAQFNLDENLRKYWYLDSKLAEQIDEGWILFKSVFKKFVKYYNVTYENFTNNKIMINKNSVKLQKALTTNPAVSKSNFDLDGNHKDSVKNFLETVNARKLPTKQKLYLVFTKNPIDMLFCSTGKNWSSCLDLTGEYNYWSGLPTTIIDKSRGMIYVTDKTKKRVFESGYFENGKYFDKKIDKMLIRSWVILCEKGLKIVGFYPNDSLNKVKIIDLINQNIPNKFLLIQNETSFISKYPITLIFNINEDAQLIYLDSSKLIEKENGVFLSSSSTSDLYFFSRRKGVKYGNSVKDIDCNLYLLYKENQNIVEYSKSFGICECCSEYSHDLTEVNGLYYCEECVAANFFVCDRCGKIEDKEEMYYDTDGETKICYDCYLNNRKQETANAS